MLGSAGLRRALSWSKDFVSDQTWAGVHSVDSGFGFDATKGLGTGANDTAIVLFALGGFDNQKVTAVVRYDSATSQANLDLGVLLRCHTTVSTEDQYYWARLDGSFAKITRVLNSSSFLTLSPTRSFALPANRDCTITFEISGTSLLATFDDGVQTPAEIAVTNAEIAGGGSIGFRTSSSSGWLKSVTVEELP